MTAASGRFYPWQAKHRDRLMMQKARDKLPHALLLSGPACLGKCDFAMALTAVFLCNSPDGGEPCGTCTGCHLLAAGTHPDFRLIEPEESRQIRIDQIRSLIDWVSQTSQRDGLKAVVIHPAEQMNPNAANALLKCLEEPAEQTLIMLVSDLPGRLLPTLRSRCQQVSFTMPPVAQALEWLRRERPELGDPELLLKIAGGAPLAVQRRFDEQFLERRQAVGRAIGQLMSGGDPLAVADKLVKADAIMALGILHDLFADALRLTLANDEKYMKNKDMGKSVKAICRSLSRRGLLSSLEAIRQEQLALAGPYNLGSQLVLESLMVKIARLCTL